MDEDVFERAIASANRLYELILEERYLRKVSAIFGPYLRRLRVIVPNAALDDETDDILFERLGADAYAEVMQGDMLLHGERRDGGGELWIAVEVAREVDVTQLHQARRRAALLTDAGFPAVAAVAGDSVTPPTIDSLSRAAAFLVLGENVERGEGILSGAGPNVHSAAPP